MVNKQTSACCSGELYNRALTSCRLANIDASTCMFVAGACS